MAEVNSGDFVSRIKAAFSEPPEDLCPSSVLRELDGWDSLTSVMIVAEIYADYRVQISGDEMRACRTVGDLMAAVETKLAATQKSIRGSSFHDFLHVRTAELHGAEAIVTLNTRDFAVMTNLPLELPLKS